MIKDLYKTLGNTENYINLFVNYYGEDYRELITNKLNSTNFVFVPYQVESFKLSEIIDKNYPLLKNTPLIDIALFLKSCPSQIKTNNLTAILESNITTGLGFDNQELFIIDNNIPQWKNKSIRNRFLAELVSLTSKVNINRIIAEQEFQISKSLLKDSKTNAVDIFITKCNELRDPSIPQIEPEQLKTKILKDLLSTKTPLTDLDQEQIKPLIDFFNYIFKTSYDNIEDFIENPKYSTIIESFNDSKNMIHTAEQNVVDMKNIPGNTKYLNDLIKILFSTTKYTKKDISELINYFTSKPQAAAYMIPEDIRNNKNNVIVVPVTEDLSYSTIIHELNHSITSHNKTTGFINSFSDKFSIGINEIVNEYITQRVLDQANISTPIKKESKPSGYNVGCVLFKNFLNSYENELKQALLSNNPTQTMEDIIGENWFLLQELSIKYLAYNHGSYLAKLSKYSGFQINSSNDIINHLEELDNANLPQSLQRYVDIVVDCTTLSNLLSINKKRFLNGETDLLVKELRSYNYNSKTI